MHFPGNSNIPCIVERANLMVRWLNLTLTLNTLGQTAAVEREQKKRVAVLVESSPIDKFDPIF